MAHVVAVLSNGEVWGWGKGRKGQLGGPSGNVWTPRKIVEIGFFATDAICGKDFTCVFGSPSTGEVSLLGLSSNDRFGVRANAMAAVPGWNQVAASWGSIFVLLKTGEVIAWGRDDHGQLPPAGLPLLNAIAAGSEHCLGLTKAGKVLAWGWGEHGNCGEPTGPNGDVKGRWNEIRLSRPVVSIFAGCATSFVVVDHGEDAG
jgi:protein ATS1